MQSQQIRSGIFGYLWKLEESSKINVFHRKMTSHMTTSKIQLYNKLLSILIC